MSSIKYNSFNSKDLGAFGESIACEYLKQKGYDILSKNFRYSRVGEIDLICRDQDNLFFIEVKTRCNDKFGNGADAVNYKKQSTIKKIAYIYMQKHNLSLNDYIVRFCVVEIKCGYKSNCFAVESINFIEDAF